MATIEDFLANPVDGPKIGRVWATLPLQGGRIVLTEHGMLIQADQADRGDGTTGPEVWPAKLVGF